MTSSAGFAHHRSSQSKRSWLMPSGRIATPRLRHDPADGDAAAGVVAGRRPDRPVAGRVELAGDDARREAGVGGEHLVGGDHREAVAEHDDDRALDAGQARWAARRGRARRPGRRRGRCTSGRATGCAASGPCGSASPTRRAWSIVDGSASSANVGSVMPCSRKRSTLLASAVVVDDPVGQAELVLERIAVDVGGGRGGRRHVDILSSTPLDRSRQVVGSGDAPRSPRTVRHDQRSSGGRVLGPTWASSQPHTSATPAHVSRTAWRQPWCGSSPARRTPSTAISPLRRNSSIRGWSFG